MDTLLHTDHQLDQLAGQFEEWRQHRAHPHERIPEPLWAQAVLLASQLSPARVAKQLRLRGNDLKKQIRKRQDIPGAGSAPCGFVEVPLAPAWPLAPATMQLELSRTDGTRLCIQSPASTLAVDAGVRAFVEGRSCCN